MRNPDLMNKVDNIYKDGGKTILKLPSMEYFDKTQYDFLDDKEFKKFMKELESTVRHSFESTELIRFLRENTGLIISTFNKSGTRNLRILKHALNDFKKVFDMVNKNYPNTDQRVLQTMLIFTIAVSFEIKAGKITKDQFINIQDNEEYKSILVSSRNSLYILAASIYHHTFLFLLIYIIIYKIFFITTNFYLSYKFM